MVSAHPTPTAVFRVRVALEEVLGLLAAGAVVALVATALVVTVDAAPVTVMAGTGLLASTAFFLGAVARGWPHRRGRAPLSSIRLHEIHVHHDRLELRALAREPLSMRLRPLVVEPSSGPLGGVALRAGRRRVVLSPRHFDSPIHFERFLALVIERRELRRARRASRAADGATDSLASAPTAGSSLTPPRSARASRPPSRTRG